MKLIAQKLNDNATIPTKAHATDLGYDLYAAKDAGIHENGMAIISTGIAFQFPDGWGALILDRSSMAAKGLFVSGGVIDNSYTGEVKVIMHNTDAENGLRNNDNSRRYIIRKGDKIAQLVLVPCPVCAIEEGTVVPSTERGDKGFGSSGV